MRLNLKEENGTAVVEFFGELDNYSAKKSKIKLDEIMQNNKSKDYIFDMKNLSFMDSSGIGVLLGRYRTIKNKGGNLYVRNIIPQVDKVFKVSGLYQVLIKIDQN